MQRLNSKPNLILVNAILVVHISIKNQSAIVDIVMSANDTIWSHYVLNTVTICLPTTFTSTHDQIVVNSTHNFAGFKPLSYLHISVRIECRR